MMRAGHDHQWHQRGQSNDVPVGSFSARGGSHNGGQSHGRPNAGRTILTLTTMINISHGFYRRLERQSSGIFENSRIPWSGVQELWSLQEFQRFQSLPFSLRIWTSLVSQRAHQMVLVVSLEYHQSTKAPSRVFQTRVFYRRKASQQIILNIMKRVGKTLRKNLSILELKVWVSRV